VRLYVRCILKGQTRGEEMNGQSKCLDLFLGEDNKGLFSQYKQRMLKGTYTLLYTQLRQSTVSST